MKKYLLRFFAIIGIISLALVALYVVVTSISKSYLEMAYEEFASPERLRAMELMYRKVEREGLDSSNPIEKFGDTSWHTVKKVPKDWIPEDFRESIIFKWGQNYLDPDMPARNDVLAYFDESGILKGIQFKGSRIGCFVSSEATFCPDWFESLHRISDKPLFVTIILHTSD